MPEKFQIEFPKGSGQFREVIAHSEEEIEGEIKQLKRKHEEIEDAINRIQDRSEDHLYQRELTELIEQRDNIEEQIRSIEQKRQREDKIDGYSN